MDRHHTAQTVQRPRSIVRLGLVYGCGWAPPRARVGLWKRKLHIARWRKVMTGRRSTWGAAGALGLSGMARLRAIARLAVTLVAAGCVLQAVPAGAALTQGPAQTEPYEVFTIGDSYASGEGAPDVNGVYDDHGHVQNGMFEDWDTRFGGSPSIPGLNQDSTRWHRSGHGSTSAVAVQELQSAFPDLAIDWRAVACSGAAIVASGHIDGSTPANQGRILRRYHCGDDRSGRGSGGAELSPAAYPTQVSQLNAIL